MNTDTLRYAGFWPRFASLWLDMLIMIPLSAATFWCSSQFRLFDVYYFIPGELFSVFYCVYLVKRYGGTPGKLLMGIKICKLDGSAIGYREAVLRYLPDFILGFLMSIALIISVFHMTDAEYHSLTYMKRSMRMIELAPSWYKPLQWIQNIWIWSEFLVLLTNRKRRAIHDFIAGTVVIHKLPKDTIEFNPPIAIQPN